MALRTSPRLALLVIIACANFLCVFANDSSTGTEEDSSTGFQLFGLSATATIIVIAIAGCLFLSCTWCCCCCLGCCKSCMKALLCSSLRKWCVRVFLRGCINCCGPDVLDEVYKSTTEQLNKGIQRVKSGVSDAYQAGSNAASRAGDAAVSAASRASGVAASGIELVRKHTLNAIQTITVKSNAPTDASPV